jgi:hypothetical protein
VFTAAQQSAARNAIGADQDTLVVLFMGRLSFHAKAHPLVMYQALEKAAKLNSSKKIVLVECGWFANDFIENAYQSAAQLSCPSVRVVTLDGRDAKNRTTAWASADVFCSLSDNIQETFGIVPIEAMAAGIPVVVSDWDGYKDTVRDGVDGFRIPTTMPGPGLGGDLALRHALEIDTYDMYCGHTCSLISVDVEATAIAFNQLFSSANLRKKMGDAGMKRAREVYDWAAIIPQYEKLWDEQNQIRKAQRRSLKPLNHPWPARMDPFTAFSHYPTQLVTSDTKLALNHESLHAAIKRLQDFRALAMINFAKMVLPSDDECETILNALSKTSLSAGDLIRLLPVERQAYVFRAISWLLKLGLLKVLA